jgi:hypothetical protein
MLITLAASQMSSVASPVTSFTVPAQPAPTELSSSQPLAPLSARAARMTRSVQIKLL